jgi:hypothetical protein
MTAHAPALLATFLLTCGYAWHRQALVEALSLRWLGENPMLHYERVRARAADVLDGVYCVLCLALLVLVR